MSDDGRRPGDGGDGNVASDSTTAPSDDEWRRSRLTETLDALANPRRRDVLYHLSENDAATIDALAAEIAARETDVRPEDVSSDDREATMVDLHHTHLPKLADAGLVEFDRRSGAVAFRDPPEMLDELLADCRSVEQRA